MIGASDKRKYFFKWGTVKIANSLRQYVDLPTNLDDLGSELDKFMKDKGINDCQSE